MKTSTLIDRTVALSELIALAGEIGATIHHDESGFHLVGPGDQPMQRLGSTVSEAARECRGRFGKARTVPGTRDHAATV